MTEVFQPLEALRTLDRHGVEYVLIGGYAATVLGSSLLTKDVDVCYQRASENHERLVAALRELRARLRVPRVDEELPFLLDVRTIQAGSNFTFTTDAGDLDILGHPSGTEGYDDLVERATDVDLGDRLVVKVAALEDLIRMKEASRRPKDQLHLLVLRALQEVLAEGT